MKGSEETSKSNPTGSLSQEWLFYVSFKLYLKIPSETKGLRPRSGKSKGGRGRKQDDGL